MRRPSSVGDRASEAQERSTVRGSAQAHSNGQNPGYGARPTRARAATRAEAARAAGPGGSNEPAKRLSTHMHTQSGACTACAVQTAKVGEYPGLAPRRARACRARQRRPRAPGRGPGTRSKSCRGRPREMAWPANAGLWSAKSAKSAFPYHPRNKQNTPFFNMDVVYTLELTVERAACVWPYDRLNP